MRNFFQRLSEGYRRFMVGRYGSDQLSRFLMFLSVVMLRLNMIFRSRTPIFYFLVWALIIYSYFRMFSKNIEKRYNENTRYLQLKEKVMNWFRNRRSSGKYYNSSASNRDSYQNYNQAYHNAQSGSHTMRSDREHRIFRCPSCDQRVRVPRGRGKIEITCPRCGQTFVKRS